MAGVTDPALKISPRATLGKTGRGVNLHLNQADSCTTQWLVNLRELVQHHCNMCGELFKVSDWVLWVTHGSG